MMTELKQTLDTVNNMQETTNGALGYSTSGMELVDLNFAVPSNHNNVSEKDKVKFIKALNENLMDTVKWMFYLRDIREGLGERDSFVMLYLTLYNHNLETALKVLPLIPVYGRWKDVIDILDCSNDDGNLSGTIYALLEKQLLEDCENMENGKSVSLLAKWMPSINSTKKARRLAKRICRNLNLLFVEYRKLLAALRQYLDVTEVKTCGRNWNMVDYNRVSSNANSRYLNAFMKHDEERRKKYLADLAKPVPVGAVMHASNLYPYEVYAKYNLHGYPRDIINGNPEAVADPGVEALWANLKNVETTGNTMVVCDGSGSMEGRINGSSTMAIDVARSLGIFFSERATGEFKDKVIEFSAYPRYIDLSECKTLADKYNTMCKYADCSNTNLEKVFDLILMTAIDNKLSQEELPQRILIVSDMEFDRACEYKGARDGSDHDVIMERYRTLFQSIKKRWDTAGYEMPPIVFWNVKSSTNTIPVRANEVGVNLVAGFSVNNVKMILAGELDPWSALKSVIDSERYKAVEEVLK